MTDIIANLASRAFDSAAEHYDLMRRRAAETFFTNKSNIVATAAALPAPEYTQLDYAKNAIAGLVSDLRLPPSYIAFLSSPEGDLSPIFEDTLDPTTIQGAYERMIDAAIRSVAIGESSPSLGRVFESALYMIGAFAGIPMDLQPSADIAFRPPEYSGPQAIWEPGKYSIDINVTMGESNGQSVFASMLHEFRHLLQYVRGLQYGNPFEIIIAPSIALLAGASVYLPAVLETDTSFEFGKDYYSAFSDHTFLRIIGAKMMTLMLENARSQDLRFLAQAFGIKTTLPAGELALKIYSEIDFHILDGFEQFAATLRYSEISEGLIDLIRTIALQKYAVYRLDPKENEVRGLMNFGLGVGNPIMIQETSAERGLLQMPLDKASRRAFYADLAYNAQARQTGLASGGVDMLVRDLIGGSGSVFSGPQQLTPAVLPHEYRDVEALQKRLTERTDRIAEAAKKSAALIEARIKK